MQQRNSFPEKVREGKDKDQESIQLSTTPDPGYQWKRNKLTIRHHKREPRGQSFVQDIICKAIKQH